MKNRASLTAEYMALFRALESSRPAGTRLFQDPYAPFFIHAWRRLLYEAARLRPCRDAVEWIFDHQSPGARAAGIARTKWIDDEVTGALRSCSQLVLLGAGFDTRAWRLPAAGEVRTYELDHPGTSIVKQAVLRAHVHALDRQVEFVTVDFNSETLTDALKRSGFDRALPACFIWEGVTNYLSAEAVDRTLRQVGQSAAGSLLLFTYVHRGVLDRPESFFGAQKLLSRLRSYGEPWTFGFHPRELDEYLAARNLRLLQDLGVAEVWANQGRRPAEMHGYEFYRVASARIPA